jgi:hypothetical protein
VTVCAGTGLLVAEEPASKPVSLFLTTKIRRDFVGY